MPQKFDLPRAGVASEAGAISDEAVGRVFLSGVASMLLCAAKRNFVISLGSLAALRSRSQARGLRLKSSGAEGDLPPSQPRFCHIKKPLLTRSADIPGHSNAIYIPPWLYSKYGALTPSGRLPRYTRGRIYEGRSGNVASRSEATHATTPTLADRRSHPFIAVRQPKRPTLPSAPALLNSPQ
jgi:hypothetical protein